MTPKPVCILGMHRSGTSLVAQLLHRCGLYLGEDSDLLPPSAEDNQMGYWENVRFLEINDAILELFGGTWQSPPSFPENWTSHPGLSSLKDKANELIADLSRKPFWGWKDPRTCLTLKFWQELLPELTLIVCVRHPSEVAQSMAVRTVSYVSESSALDLWADYNENLLSQLAGQKYLVTHCASYFYRPEEEIARMLRFAGQTGNTETLRDAVTIVRPELWRSFLGGVEEVLTFLPDRVRSTYEILCADAGQVFEAQLHDAEYQTEVRSAALAKAMKRIARLEKANDVREAEVVRLNQRIERLSSKLSIYQIPRTLLLGSLPEKRELFQKVKRRTRGLKKLAPFKAH